MKLSGIFLLTMALLTIVLSGGAWATPEHSERTGQGCMSCHKSVEGGALNEIGLRYAASGYRWPPKGGFRVLGPIRKPVRFLIGFFHITASFIWFGTILYVHIMLRPGYAKRGLPRGEVMLGSISMLLVGITGVLLTISRVGGLDVLMESSWGRLLSTKISLYLIMLCSAAIAVTIVGPRLKKEKQSTASVPADGVFDAATLTAFNGKEGRSAYIAYQGKVLDVTALVKWKGGIHMKHLSGTDLTEALKRAPHGEEKLEGLPVVGTFDPERKPRLSPPQKSFYIIAYLNLVLVFAVLFVISVWRWGI